MYYYYYCADVEKASQRDGIIVKVTELLSGETTI